MKRGEIWTVAGGRYYAGKPRPAVILEDNRFGDLVRVTTNPTNAPLFRVPVEPSEENGLRVPRRLMVD
jgi:mRNA interferase MazF